MPVLLFLPEIIQPNLWDALYIMHPIWRNRTARLCSHPAQTHPFWKKKCLTWEVLFPQNISLCFSPWTLPSPGPLPMLPRFLWEVALNCLQNCSGIDIVTFWVTFFKKKTVIRVWLFKIPAKSATSFRNMWAAEIVFILLSSGHFSVHWCWWALRYLCCS